MSRARLKPLNSQVIVITGATSGIGLATAQEAAKRGARLFLIARDGRGLRTVADELAGRGASVDFAVADVADRHAIEHAAALCVQRFGRIDTWINDAGAGAYATLEEIDEADHRRIFETNYWGVVHGTLAALAQMKRSGGGAIINIGSIASDIPAPLLSAYVASKHAVKGFTDSLRLELLHEQAPISLTLIKPSSIGTPFTEHARNYMDVAPSLPPPVYHPRTVANAILYAAETPTRSLIVGGAGVLMTLLASIAPKLADRIYAPTFFNLARDASRPPPRGDGLTHASRDAPHVTGPKPGRPFSVWTTLRTHPRLSMLALAAGAGALALSAARGGPQQRTAGARPALS